MAATQTQIDNYIASIRYAHAEFVDTVAKRAMLNGKNSYCNNIKVTLLAYYVKLIEDYFAQNTEGGDTYEDYNFFDTDEATDIMQHINAICGTNYFLDIT